MIMTAGVAKHSGPPCSPTRELVKHVHENRCVETSGVDETDRVRQVAR